MGDEEQKPQEAKPDQGQTTPVQRPAADPDLDDYHKKTWDPAKNEKR